MHTLDWRRPPRPVDSADYATYVKILTWFFDSPDPLCPFSVHRMALAGKELGTEVGCWFGPSTAAGAIKYVLHVVTIRSDLRDFVLFFQILTYMQTSLPLIGPLCTRFQMPV